VVREKEGHIRKGMKFSGKNWHKIHSSYNLVSSLFTLVIFSVHFDE
jgi:hypothetical protein